jgi:phosphoserine/homoserine phosphotransferase
MLIVCLDLEGVLVPEIWIAVAERTRIEGLRLTTRDVADYDVLMQHRLQLLAAHDLRLPAITDVIDGIEPLAGAQQFLDALRAHYQVVILSDTYYEFAQPLMRKLGWPTLLCHRLTVAPGGAITGYRIRQKDPKRMAVRALKSLSFRTIAAGDSYNDIPMLDEADAGFFFRAPERVRMEHPRFPATEDYATLRARIDERAAALLGG